ncbi:MAG: Sphingobium phage Lacusarx, partial [Pseudomonadota bacterium]
MAQLLVATAGAAIGFAIGGPMGAKVGWALGSAVGSSIDAPRQHGPRVEDLKVQISSFGAPIPKTYGTDRVAGVLIWAADFVETAHKQGGKGGPKVTTYSYTCSFAVAIGDGEVGAVRRIWADTKLVYDARVGGEDPIAVQNAKFRQFWTLYPGSETQEPDATIEAVEGAGNVEAYRGTCYVVFTNLPLGDYGNRIPSFSFELTQETEDTTPTADILEPLKVYPWVYNEDSMPVHAIGDTYYQAMSSPTAGGA